MLGAQMPIYPRAPVHPVPNTFWPRQLSLLRLSVLLLCTCTITVPPTQVPFGLSPRGWGSAACRTQQSPLGLLGHLVASSGCSRPANGHAVVPTGKRNVVCVWVGKCHFTQQDDHTPSTTKNATTTSHRRITQSRCTNMRLACQHASLKLLAHKPCARHHRISNVHAHP